MRFLLIALIVIAAMAMIAQNVGYTPDSSWLPPKEAAARVNPLAKRPELAAGGRKLFLRDCAQCHGDDGRGLKTAADLQLPVVQEQTDGTIFWKITNGNAARGMPAFSAIPEMQRWQLVLHIRTLRRESK